MASSSYPTRTFVRAAERAALVALIGVIGVCLAFSLFLGPVLLFPVLVCALLSLGVAELLRREEARQAAGLAAGAGAREPVEVWGKIVHVAGRCPTGTTPAQGQMFAVAGGEVWPEVCIHARRTILDEVARMERDGRIDEEPARYHDADHQMEFELYRAPTDLRAAA